MHLLMAANSLEIIIILFLYDKFSFYSIESSLNLLFLLSHLF